MPETIFTGQAINDEVRKSGVCALVDLGGDRIWFYPRGRLTRDACALLDANDGRNARLLRDFLVNLGRGIR
jgi:hypothetical protein